MYPLGAVIGLGLVFFIWNLVLTILFLRERNFLHELFPKTAERDIRNKFKEILEALDNYAQVNDQLSRDLQSYKKQGLNHFQRLSIIRYNPYNDTGGDQSFSIALVDGKLNGVLITSLHSRAGTRVYSKIILQGKSDLELSKEEKEILAKVVI